mgnify:FL=1|tara:strand:+ start:2558 stop:3745 length:1188 start_codon:yes stop_codon:yes gene_type:complete
MANALLTPSVITKEALAILHQKLNFVGNINTQYDDQYAKSGAKIGNDLKIRLPNEFTVRSGATLSSQDVAESSTTLTVDTQKGVDFTFSSEELTMHIDEFKDRYLEPAMSVLAANIESDALSMYKDVYNFYSGVGAANSFGNITQAQKLLTDSLAPYGDRSYLHNPQSVVDMLADTKGLFQDSSSISKQYKDGQLGKIAGFEHYENTLMPVHTTGTAAATTGYLVNGASQSGSSLTVDGGTTTFLKGDVVTIAGVNRVHPETKANTGVLQQFVVTADSGTSATTLAVSPAITATGGRQNVSAVPADNAAISKIGGGASADWQETLAFSKNAFAFATADLILPNGVDFAAREVSDGISMRIVRDYAISSDTMPCRIDVLYGYKAIRPQLAARVGIN